MFNVNKLFRHAVLALALLGSSFAAVAAPVSYHVDLDTTTLNNTSGYIDLRFGAFTSAPLTNATFSNFSGAFNGVDYFDGAVSFNSDGSFTLNNLPDLGSVLSFSAAFGGKLGFDLLFSDDQASAAPGLDGSTLSIALLNDDFQSVGGNSGVLSFDLTPGFGASATVLNAGFAAVGPVAVNDVPEPGDWMMMATGLALLGFTLRRRAQ
jgi:hypothetical protein